MSDLLHKSEQFVHSAELVNSEATWAYLHSHKLREMNFLDQDFDQLYSSNPTGHNQGGGASGSTGGATGSSSNPSQTLGKREPIERFASLIDTEEPKFEKQRQESIKNNVQAISATCEASIAGINAFYQRKVESLDAILTSGFEGRDRNVPRVSLKEFDEDRHLDLALAPWPFLTMPGARSSQWPEGLPEFVERLETMQPLSLWNEPLDTLEYGVDFYKGVKEFLSGQIEKVKKAIPEPEGSPLVDSESLAHLSRDLGIGLHAIVGFAVLSANSDFLMDGLVFMSRIEKECPTQAAAVFEPIAAPLRRYLISIQDQLMKKSNYRYLDTTKASGVFSVAKFVSFAQQHEHNTSITTDGQYLYIFVAIPQKAMMYKIGTGSTDSTIAGKVYLEKKADREGDVSWTYCQGKLFSRRVNEEFGVITLYDADTLNTIGDAKLLCGDIFSSSNCHQSNRYYPILTDGKSIFIITMKIVQKRRQIKPEMRKQYQQIQEEKKINSAKSAELEKEKAAQREKDKLKQNASKTEKEILLEKKKEIERKQLVEMQAREEELLRSRVAAQRGRDGRRGRRGGREYGRGGARVPGDGRRGAPAEDPHDLKLNGGKDSVTDPSSYKVCQFYLHEFKTTKPKAQNPMSCFFGEKAEVITEIEQAFCGFFESNECDTAYKDHNLDPCEAAYQLACDAEENRYKLTLPLNRSVLLCESLIQQDPSGNKKSNEGDIQVVEDSVLTPSCLHSGKWIINGENITYHQNIMQDNTMIHVFSTNDEDEKPMTQLARTKSTPLPSAQSLSHPVLIPGKSMPPSAPQLLAKDFCDQGLNPADINLDSNGLFDFKQPDLQRDRDFFKQMILNGEDLDEFGDAPMDFFAREFRQLQQDKNIGQDDPSGDDGPDKDELDEKDMMEEIKLLGTHRISLKNQEGLNPNYRGTITYDSINRKYYVLVLANQSRYVAVVSDLHRFSENFVKFQDNESESDELGIQSLVDMIPAELKSSQEFQLVCFDLLQRIEKERFNMPWRWNHWSNLYSHAVSYKHLKDQALQDQAHQQLQPLSQQLKKNESQVDLGCDEHTNKQVKLREKLLNQQRNKQILKLQSRLQKVVQGETEQLREEYGFQYQEEEGKQLQDILQKKKDEKPRNQNQNHGKQQRGKGGKKGSQGDDAAGKRNVEDFKERQKELEDLVPNDQGNSVREMARQNMRSIYERAKTFIVNEEGPQPAGSSSVASHSGKQPDRYDKVDSEADLLMPPSFLGNFQYGHYRNQTNERFVLPVEHVLIHKEVKKIYTFCQSGKVSTLANLFTMLKNLDGTMTTETPQSQTTSQKLRGCLLQQILIWSTFADQLAAVHQKDLELLNQIHRYIVDHLQSNFEQSSPQTTFDDEIYWKILIVGWDYFCRSTFQQLDVLQLALKHQSKEIDNLTLDTQESPALRIGQQISCSAQKIGLPSEDLDDLSKESEPSIYQLLLDTTLDHFDPDQNSCKPTISPISLFHSRFFRSHKSFYNLEILNKSIVTSYVVVLDTHIYQKAIQHLHQVQVGIGQPQQDPGEKDKKGSDAKKDEENKDNKIDFTQEEQYLEPVRGSVMNKSVKQVFGSYQTVPISLAAIASEVKAPAGGLQFTGPGGFGYGQNQPQKHGKKNKGKKGQEKGQEKEAPPRRGFALEAVAWKHQSNLWSSSSPGSREDFIVSSKLFSMPIGSSFVSDPVVLEGISALKQPSQRDMKKAPTFHPEKVINKYDADACLISRPDMSRQQYLEQLQEAEDVHQKRSVELIDSFIAAIQKSFSIDQISDSSAKFQSRDEVANAAISKHQQILISTFVNLAQHAQGQNLSLKTVKDLDLVSKVLKLVQSLIKQELSYLDQKKIDEMRIIEIIPLLNFIIQMISMSILNDASCMPLLGYQFLPGLVNVVSLLKEGFRVQEPVSKESPNASPAQSKAGLNLLDCLQALTSEGIDFSREKIFETPHPYPQNDFSLSETIEVPKAIGFIVELDKRCSAEHSTDQLVMYSGSDHIFNINQNFATQIKLSTKPNTKQPYFLLGSRMKIDFRSYSHRSKRAGGQQPPPVDPTAQKSSAQIEARWGYKVIVRPIYSEPSNIILSGPVRGAQRKQIYAQLGGEINCHKVEVVLNSLVCLASQFSKELAQIESFTPINDHWNDGLENLDQKLTLTSIKNQSIQKLAKQQLFKGGICAAQLLIGSNNKDLLASGKSKSKNYHEIIQQELNIQQDKFALEFQRMVSTFLTATPESKAPEKVAKKEGPNQFDLARISDHKQSSEVFIPSQDQWSPKVKDLLTIDIMDDQSQSQSLKSTAGLPKTKTYKVVSSQLLDKVHAKIRELVQTPLAVKQQFMKPKAKVHMPEWNDVEKLLIVALLYHSKSLHLVPKIVDIKVPNLRSSGGVFQYGTGIKGGVLPDESYFLIDQLKLIGNQVNDLLMWLILRVKGEIDTQDITEGIFETTQRMIDERLEKKKIDDEEEAKQKALEEEKIQKALEEEKKRVDEIAAKRLEEMKGIIEEEKQKAAQEEQKSQANKNNKASSEPVLVTGNKNRKMKRGKIVRRAMDNTKAKKVVKKDQSKQKDAEKDKQNDLDSSIIEEEKADVIGKKKEAQEEAKAEEDQQIVDDTPKYVDLSLSQINELKNQIEQKVYADLSSNYLGPGADASNLKPLCLLFNLKYNSDDPTETVRQVFKKIKGRISKVINLDDIEDPKLLANINDEQHSNVEQFRTSPYVGVCKDVKSRLLVLLEIKPSIEYLNNVTKIDATKCFSRYGSIKFSQKGGMLRNRHAGKDNEDYSESESNKQSSQQNLRKDFEDLESEHDDELMDQMNMELDENDGEVLAPLTVERANSLPVGQKSSFNKKREKGGLKRFESVKDHEKSTKNKEKSIDQESQNDWLEIHRKWKLWNKYHNQTGTSAEDKDLSSPFCSPLHSVLQFAKQSEIQDPSPIRQLLCEQQKRAAFRLFALKYQGKLSEIVQKTPYQRFIWGNQSHSMINSSLDRIESCGETFVNKINERSKKLVKQLMSYIVIQADNMKHYQDILEKYLKQQDAKTASGSSSSKSSKNQEQLSSKKSTNSMSQGKDSKNRSSPKESSTADSSGSYGGSEPTDRRIQKITFDDFIPWQMKTVMHSLNDLRVLLNDPFTQAYVLEALKEDQFKFIAQNLEKETKLSQKERDNEADKDNEDGENNGISEIPISKNIHQDCELGFQNIKQFLKALIQTMLQSNPSSPLAEQFPNSSRLCQSAFKVAKIVLSQFVSDKQQIREAETSKILQEMMLEILVSHLEKVCGLDQPPAPASPSKESDSPNTEKKDSLQINKLKSKSLAKAVEDTNLDEIVQLLKLLQETMRMSSDTQQVMAQHQMIAHQVADTQSINKACPTGSLKESQFLSEGSTQVMRCAKLLAYLMIEFEVPVIVRHAIRCAKIFFFGLVDFRKLELYQGAELQKIMSLVTDQEEQIDSAPAVSSEKVPSSEGELSNCCENKFIIATLTKIGQRISNSQDMTEKVEEIKQEEGSKVAPPTESEPEGSSLIEEEAEPVQKEEAADDKTDAKADEVVTRIENEDLDKTNGKKYVVYANINSQIEDFTFLVTALYHWEKTKPAVALTQPSDPKLFMQKSTKPAKKEFAEDKKESPKPASEQKESDKKEEEKKQEGNEEKKEEGKKEDEPAEEAKEKAVVEPKNENADKPEDAKQEPPEDKDGDKKEEESKKEEEAKVAEGDKKEVEQKVEEQPEPPKKEESVEEEKKADAPQPESSPVVEDKADKPEEDEPKPASAEESKEEAKLEDSINLKQNFELFRLKKETQEKCDKLLKDILNIEQNKDLIEQLHKQHKQGYQSLIGDLIKKDTQVDTMYARAAVEKELKAQLSMSKKINGISSSIGNFMGASNSKLGMTTVVKGAIVGNGSQMSEVNLVPNQILIHGSQSQSAPHSINQKLSIYALQTAFVEIAKQSHEVIYDDDSSSEQIRKLNSRNWNERVLHHIFQSMCIASQLQQRYSVPVTEPMEHKEALQFAKILERAYKEQDEPVPINPHLKEEFHHKKCTEGKKLSQFFPFTLKNVKAGCKEPELPPGHAPPVVICQKALVVSLTTEKFSKDIEKIIESRASNLKALEKNPSDGFRLNVCKNNLKRQGSSVSSCILTLIQFLREVLVGPSQKQSLKTSKYQNFDQGSTFNDAASQKSSVAGYSESNQNRSEKPNQDLKQANKFMRQQEMRQEEIMKIINHSLELLKTQKWQDIKIDDKHTILGLFTVIGGWYGFTRVTAGSQVLAQINGCWNEATVVDEGVGKRRVSVILNEDSSLSLVKVPHTKIKPLQTSMDKGINDKLNFDNLCEAITFLHQQQDQPDQEESSGQNDEGRVNLDDAMISENVLFQMLLKVSSKLNWNKIDHNSKSFNQFRQILIQVTSQSSQVDGQSHEDKNEDYLEKQLIESWERIIDRCETKNIDFYSPREACDLSEDPNYLDVKRSSRSPQKKEETKMDNQEILDFMRNAINPYVDTDYEQPRSSYLNGLPEPIVKRNQKEAALKLLFYWEKNVLPTTREFVRSTFQKWEMIFYFEQIRHHLRQGDQRAALGDAMTLWENKVPNGVNLPSENTDWTAKVADECMVDSWALAKISFSKSSSSYQGGSSSSKQAQSLQSETSLPLILRLQNLGVQAVVIQIKLVDARYNVVLGEFYDGENFCSHFIWFPISHLYDLDYPLPPRPSGYLRKNLTRNYLHSISAINSLYARKTLIQFFSSTQSSISKPLAIQSDQKGQNSQDTKDGQGQVMLRKEQFGELKLHELISWSVQEEFSDNPFNGWLRDLNCAIPIRTAKESSKAIKESKTDSGAQEMLHKLIEETSDKIIIERLLQMERDSQQDSSGQEASNQIPSSTSSETDSSGNPLRQIRDLFKNAVTLLNQYQGKDQEEAMKKSDAYQTLSELADWTATNWHMMSEHVGSNRAVFDLCKQQSGKNEANGQQSSDRQLISLHSVIQSSKPGAATKDAVFQQSIATLLMFHKQGCNLTPCSKIQFYSDPNQVNLVSEITAGSEARTTLPPILLNHGQIWAKVLPGSLALLRKDMQLEAKSSLPCAIFQIPKQWGVVCWLTETLSSSFLECSTSQIDLAQQIYQKLISALISFYQDSSSPQMIKSQVLSLLTRLVRKLRYIMRKEIDKKDPSSKSDPVTQEAHFEQIFVNCAFVKCLLDDMDTFKREEEKALDASKSTEKQLLYSSFLQDSVEFLMTLIIPINPYSELKSYKDVLDVKEKYLSSLKDWLDPLMKTSIFMHYFNNEIKCLPFDLLQEIHSQTQLSRHRSLDHILLIDRVPMDEKLYPKAWLVDQIIGMCKKHHARILDPKRDIHFEEDEYEVDSHQKPAEGEKVKERETAKEKKKCYKVLVVLDGWNHLTPLPDYEDYFDQKGQAFEGFDQIASDDYRNFVSLVDSDTEDDQEDPEAAAAKEEQQRQEEEKRKKEEEDMKPTEWACPLCTFVNSTAIGTCDICGSGKRPPMAELIAAFKKQKEEEAAALDPVVDEKKDDKVKEADDASKTKITHENIVRLKFLARDISKMVKVEQKRIFLKDRAENLERMRLDKLKAREDKLNLILERHYYVKRGFKILKGLSEKKQEDGSKPESGGKDKKKKEEEKKHADSDAEKSDEDDVVWADVDSDHSGSSGSDQKEMLSMAEAEAVEKAEADNNEDPRQKLLAELGYDLSILDADPQLAAALLASANLQQEQIEEENRRKKEEEEAEKKRLEEERIREKRQKELEQLKKDGMVSAKVSYHYLDVLYGMESIQENQNAVRAMFKFLQMRLQDLETGEPSEKCKGILKDIHESLQKIEEDEMIWPEEPFEDQLSDYGLSKEAFKTMELEEFEQTCSVLMAADVVLLFRFLGSQGYDFWLQKQTYPSFKAPNQGLKFNSALFEKLKDFVEISFCLEKKVVQQLEPYQLRLLSKMQDRDSKKPVETDPDTAKPEEEEPQADQIQEANEGEERNKEDEPKIVHDPSASVCHYDDSMISMNASLQGKHHWYNQVSQADISYNWALIKTFSKYFATTVPFIDCSTSIADTPAEGAIPITISAYMSSLRNLCLSNTKSELKHLILKNTSVERDKVPTLRFERLKLAAPDDNAANASDKDGGRRTDPNNQAQAASGNQGAGSQDQNQPQTKTKQSNNFLFTQAYEQVKDIDHGALRPAQPRGAEPHLSFEVDFIGEHVVGEGGPYRQFFSDISDELRLVAPKSGEEDGEHGENGDEANAEGAQGQEASAQGAKTLGLLCQSSNMLGNAEKGKDNFTLNPRKASSRDLSLFNFLGILMGVCIRTNTNLGINLPSLVWKQLVGQRLDVDDISEFDEAIQTELKGILAASAEDFEAQFGDRFFTTRLSDQAVVPLEEGGSAKALTYENRVDYVKKVLHARMTECEAQCRAIKRGMCQIIPAALLNMVGHQELEEWVYGKKTIDIALLRRHTDSKAFPEGADAITWFWEILEEMSQEERRKFIRFCYAQATIPANDEEFERQQVRFLLRPVAGGPRKGETAAQRDQRLPKADTCFFNFELPNYSSKEAMKKRILFAISFDNVSLNAEQGAMNLNDAASHHSRASRDSY